MSGFFFVFEGPDASGKSTQSKLLAKTIGALWTRQPGGTPVGETLREMLISNDVELSSRAETLLMLADRAQHVQQLIQPTLSSGQSVVCDRYTGSTIAYQGWGRGNDLAELERMSDYSAGGLQPHMTFYLDISQDGGMNRMVTQGRVLDTFETLDTDFHARVRLGYNQQAKEKGWTSIDGSGTIEEVSVRVHDAYREFVRERTLSGSTQS